MGKQGLVGRLNRNLRVVAAPCRSGTTALGNSFSQHPQVEAYYQAVKTGLRSGDSENHSLFFSTRDKASKKFVVDKETYGPHTAWESSFRLFPSDDTIALTRPVFLFRDPIWTWNSWIEQGWMKYELFELAYVSVFQTYRYATQIAGPLVTCMTYESLVEQPRRTLQAICRHWVIPYHRSLISWTRSFKPNATMIGGEDFIRSKEEGSFRTVEESNTIRKVNKSLVVPAEDITKILSGPLWVIYNTVREEELGRNAKDS